MGNKAMIEIIPNWHPVFVHFPIAFATAAVAFTTIGTVFKNRSWTAQCLMTGRWMLWAAAIFACIAALFGWLAYNSVVHDEAGHLAMTLHRNRALFALGALGLLVVLDIRSWGSSVKPSHGFLILLVLAWLLVVSTSWHGGELVYRHGLGVISLTKPEVSGHHHEHGEGHGEMPVQSEEALHEEVHTHSHNDTVDGVGTPVEKVGHIHAPGTAPHKD